jgi:hypothetical protein
MKKAKTTRKAATKKSGYAFDGAFHNIMNPKKNLSHPAKNKKDKGFFAKMLDDDAI